MDDGDVSNCHRSAPCKVCGKLHGWFADCCSSECAKVLKDRAEAARVATMDDVTAKVLAETWEADEESGYPDLVMREVFAAGDVTIHRFAKLEHDDATAQSRARLAACAPEALRLLLEAEWAGGDMGSSAGFCPWCECSKHAPDCRWLALMQKAGLR